MALSTCLSSRSIHSISTIQPHLDATRAVVCSQPCPTSTQTVSLSSPTRKVGIEVVGVRPIGAGHRHRHRMGSGLGGLLRTGFGIPRYTFGCQIAGVEALAQAFAFRSGRRGYVGSETRVELWETGNGYGGGVGIGVGMHEDEENDVHIVERRRRRRPGRRREWR